MKRLGYTRFVAQGGDVGAFVCDRMAEQAPPELLGIHTNFPGTVPPDVFKVLQAGERAAARAVGRGDARVRTAARRSFAPGLRHS